MFDVIEAEKRVIGSVVFGLEKSTLSELLRLLDATDFTVRDHKHLWWCIQNLVSRGEDVDELTLSSESTEAHVTPASLSILTDQLVSTTNVMTSARMVLQAARGRRATARFRALADQVEKHQHDGETLDDAISQAAQLHGSVQRRHPAMSELVDEYYDHLEARMRGEQEPFSSGIQQLDAVMAGGIRPGEMWVVGGRPGTGKSALVTQIAWRAAKRGQSVWFASCEMAARDVIERVICAELRLSSQKLRSPQRLTSTERASIAGLTTTLKRDNWYIRAYGSPTVDTIKADALRHKAVHGLDCIVVDYLQLLGGTSRSSYERVSEASRQLKALAIDLEVPVIALAQLRRSQDDSEPSMSDLKDSGQIEQDADVITLLHETREGGVDLLVDKQRSGARRIRLALQFRGDHYTFYAPGDAPPAYKYGC